MITARDLTAYAKNGGGVDLEDYIDAYIDSELHVSTDMVWEYNDYLDEQNMYDDRIYSMDELNDIFYGMKPEEIFQLAIYSAHQVSLNDNFFKFDGYGNVKTMNDEEVCDAMRDDRDFLRHYVDTKELIDEDEAYRIVDDANKLIKQGY